MSRSSFGQPPQPQLGMAGPKAVGPGPMSSPKMAPQGMSPMAPPQALTAPSPSMFRRPRY